ncbi:hypothetical protein SERLA73DRAFT_176569, partial [Serpula lacrymans var. lacrymans S7.3]
METYTASATHLLIDNYFRVSVTAIFAFEYLSNFDDEIELGWRSRWGAGKVLLLLARYIPFVMLPTSLYACSYSDINPSTCLSLFYFVIILNTAIILTSECILSAS